MAYLVEIKKKSRENLAGGAIKVVVMLVGSWVPSFGSEISTVFTLFCLNTYATTFVISLPLTLTD